MPGTESFRVGREWAPASREHGATPRRADLQHEAERALARANSRTCRLRPHAPPPTSSIDRVGAREDVRRLPLPPSARNSALAASWRRSPRPSCRPAFRSRRRGRRTGGRDARRRSARASTCPAPMKPTRARCRSSALQRCHGGRSARGTRRCAASTSPIASPPNFSAAAQRAPTRPLPRRRRRAPRPPARRFARRAPAPPRPWRDRPSRAAASESAAASSPRARRSARRWTCPPRCRRHGSCAGRDPDRSRRVPPCRGVVPGRSRPRSRLPSRPESPSAPREPRVEPVGLLRVRAEARRHARRDDLDDAAERVAIARARRRSRRACRRRSSRRRSRPAGPRRRCRARAGAPSPPRRAATWAAV